MKLAPEEKKRLRQVERSVDYSFKKPGLLKKALTHKSYANENKLPPDEQNERLEFLGDAVLELAVSELLMEKYPDYSEGDLSKLRAAVVNEKQLARFARAFGLGDKLYLGKGEEQTSGREKPSLLADAVEAVLGAIYLDRGFDKAKQVVRKHYSKLLDHAADGELYKDYKTELQEKSQSLYRSIPRYRMAAETGPDHEKTFEVEIVIRGEVLGRGTGRSKKDAEQQAAREALAKLNA